MTKCTKSFCHILFLSEDRSVAERLGDSRQGRSRRRLEERVDGSWDLDVTRQTSWTVLRHSSKLKLAINR